MIDAVKEYERIMQLPYEAPETIAPAAGTFRLAEIKDHKRRYVEGAAS